MAPQIPVNVSGKEKTRNGGDLGFEAALFKTADKLRGNIEPSDYKHVAFGLIFLKHILKHISDISPDCRWFGSQSRMAGSQTVQPARQNGILRARVGSQLRYGNNT